MRRIIFSTGIVAVLLFGGLLFAQQHGKHKHELNEDWRDRRTEMMDTCQRMMNESSMIDSGVMGGEGMMGSGMMGGMGMMGMMGRGMMDREMMNRMRMHGLDAMGTKLSQPLNKEAAVNRVQRYIRSLENPRLTIGKVEGIKDSFIVEIVTKKEGALVEKVSVDKETGQLTPAE